MLLLVLHDDVGCCSFNAVRSATTRDRFSLKFSIATNRPTVRVAVWWRK